MKRKILIPTDFSKNAENAIKYAIELYKNEECDFYLLNVFFVIGFATDNIMVPEIGEIAYKTERKTSENELKTALKLLEKNNTSKHHFFTISKFNSLLNSIDEVVEEKNIDIIIMGTQGATNASNIIFGSNTVTIMEKERSCPVLAIPSVASYSKPKEIVFPTSYNTPYKKRELKHLIDIATINKAAIKILHIEKDKEQEQSERINRLLLDEYFDGIEHSFHILYNVEVETALDCFVQSRESDMIAFINKKHSFIDSIFTRHLAEELGYKSKIPVLVMHNL